MTTSRGVVGFFTDPQSLVKATHQVREAGFELFDVFTPFPVHGLDEAQGLKPSVIPFFTFAAAVTGCVSGFLLQYMTSVVDWPIIVGGKPFNSLPAFVPIMFELTVLFAGLTSVGAMLWLNRLPNLKYRSLDSSITSDRFAIWIEKPPEKPLSDYEVNQGKTLSSSIQQEQKTKGSVYDEASIKIFLESCGAHEVRGVSQEGWFS